MATTYKDFGANDIINSKTLLHENIPLTSSIVKGDVYACANIKSYAHGMYESVFDYPYQSSSANQLFDMTAGLAVGSPGYNISDPDLDKKVNMYNQLAQVLLGYDATGSILTFDEDGDTATSAVDEKIKSCFILNFNRLLVKDEIKKGSFNLTLGISTDYDSPFTETCLISDISGSNSYRVNSPTGEYGILYASNFTGNNGNNTEHQAVGLIFYQAGIAVISTAVFALYDSNSTEVSMDGNNRGQLLTAVPMKSGIGGVQDLFRDHSIDEINECFRNRIANISINNTTQLNSTIHFCRVGANEFNYSSNPTYLNGSKVYVTDGDKTVSPHSYITTVGLYSSDNQLLAVAKLSQPLKKTFDNEMILRVRLDY